MQTKAQQYLNQAVKDMQDRAGERDQPEGERSMVRTVNAFNAMHGTSLTEVQGWQFMELLKMARSIGGDFRADDFIDGSAYAALAGEAAASIDAGKSSKSKVLEPPFVEMHNKATQLYAGRKYYIQLVSDTGYHLVTYIGKYSSVNGLSDTWKFEDGREVPLLRSFVSVFDKLMNEGDYNYQKVRLKNKYYMLRIGARYNIALIKGRAPSEIMTLEFKGNDGDDRTYWVYAPGISSNQCLFDNDLLEFVSVVQ